MVSVDVKHYVYLLTSYPLLQPATQPIHHPASQSDNSHPHLPINQSVSIVSGPASQTTHTHTYPSTNLFPSSAAQPVRQLTPTLTHQPICFHHQRPSRSDNSHPHLSINQSVSFISGPAGTVDGIAGSEYARFCWKLVKLTDVIYFLYQLTGNAPQPCHHSLSRQVIIMSCQLLCDGVHVNCHVMSIVT